MFNHFRLTTMITLLDRKTNYAVKLIDTQVCYIRKDMLRLPSS